MTGIEPAIILLVEDEPLVRMVAHDALETGGFSVIDAIDGNEAIKILDHRAHELAGLITDVQSGLDPMGWEVAKHARKLLGDLPVLYTTTDSRDQWPSEGVPHSLLVQKPYAPAQLLTGISGLIISASSGTH